MAAGRGLDSMVQDLWERARPLALERLDVLDDAVAAVMVGALDADLRQRARRESHKLAGSLGTFGLRDATERAAALAEAFATAPCIEQAPELAEHAVALRKSVESGHADGAAVASGREAEVVAVGLAMERAVALAAAGQERGLAVDAASEVDAAATAPVALLDGGLDKLPEAVERLAAGGATVALLLRPDSPHDPVELVRRGARRLLPADAAPDALVDALAALTESRRPPAGRVLALDDDPTVLLVIEAILGGAGYEVATLEDPLAVWAALERMRPDLMVCDVDMPGLDGIDLCRTLRADSRWQNLPLIFLTGHSTPEVVSELFAAGADDYVNKPVLGPELLARVRNRLERVALQRALDDVDRLTGLLRRDSARPQLDGLLSLGTRLGQPVCLAAFAVDELARLNRELGHAAGDEALATAGRALRATFAADGVAARWGGGELVVGMLGLNVHDARDRIGAVLEEVRAMPVPAAGGHITLRLARFTVMDSLIRIGARAVEPLCKTIADSADVTTVAALRVGAMIADPRLAGPARARLGDADPAVRAWAVRLLGAVGGDENAAAVEERLADPAPEVRAAAALALGRLGHWMAAGRLGTRLGDPAWEVRRNAALALRSFGSPGELLLNRALRDEDPFARDMARQTLDLPEVTLPA